MELHLYYRSGAWYCTIHHIKDDREAERYVRHTAERDDEIGTWKLLGGTGLVERAIWKRLAPDDGIPRLINVASDYTGQWQNRTRFSGGNGCNSGSEYDIKLPA